MANKHEHHAEYKHLPATGVRARELGEIYYFTGKRCTKGHLSPRYASSGNCVQCIADVRGKTEINYKGRSSKRSKENQFAAMQAVTHGFTEYQATEPCPQGHYRRYVTTNNCIDCNDIKRQQRSEKARWARIKKEYGLSASDVFEMLGSQRSACLICGVSIASGYHIDHCHSSGKVRGLLCSKCNQAIGLFDEDQNRLQKAANYIARFSRET
jgi:hypothetical protein